MILMLNLIKVLLVLTAQNLFFEIGAKEKRNLRLSHLYNRDYWANILLKYSADVEGTIQILHKHILDFRNSFILLC